MHVALFYWGRLPVESYGGTQRMAVYLARGLVEAGHRVTLLAGPGSLVPGTTVVPIEPEVARRPDFLIEPHLPRGLDVLLSFVEIRRPPLMPWIWRLAGNRQPGVRSAPNTIHLSANHAARHGGTAFVYNGIDPADFRFRRDKGDYDLFLGRLHRVKGYRWAVEGAKRSRRRLVVAGGWRPSLRRSIRYVGQVGGDRKVDLLAGARCLWMPALWDEPFGITLIEALASGTPVLGTPRGSLPEVISSEVGALGDSVDELVALRDGLDQIDPDACRARVERHFTHNVMAAEYVRMFRGFLATGVLPAGRTTALLNEPRSP
jgi:glycosyltransferase involved in cell wall biosynthesis